MNIRKKLFDFIQKSIGFSYSFQFTKIQESFLSPVAEVNPPVENISIHTVDEFSYNTSSVTSQCVGLYDVTGNTIVLELNNKTFYKATIPNICSTKLGLLIINILTVDLINFKVY